jgi:hypothetical protein
MARKRTREELEKALHDMGAYQEAFWALNRGEKRVKLTSGDHSVWLLGLGRASGGVVMTEREGYSVHYAERWASDASRSVDPYIADLGRQVFRAVANAIKARYAESTPRVLPSIPPDYPVQPLKDGQVAECRALCGTCGLAWDDGVSTSMTPTPSARCPFEAFHE